MKNRRVLQTFLSFTAIPPPGEQKFVETSLLALLYGLTDVMNLWENLMLIRPTVITHKRLNPNRRYRRTELSSNIIDDQICGIVASSNSFIHSRFAYTDRSRQQQAHTVCNFERTRETSVQLPRSAPLPTGGCEIQENGFMITAMAIDITKDCTRAS